VVVSQRRGPGRPAAVACEDATVAAWGEVSTHVLAGAGPHDPPRLLSFIGAHAVRGIEVWDGATYGRTLKLPGGPAIVAVAAALDTDSPAPPRAAAKTSRGGYAVTLRLSDPADLPAALDGVRHLMALDVDVTKAERQLSADPVLAPLFAARSGLRPPGSVDHAETLIRTVIGQQVSLAGARALGARLVAAHGEPLPPAWATLTAGLTHLWPRGRTLAGLPSSDPALAMPTARARTLVAAAGAVVAARGQLPPAADLLALPGVGPWTAQYVDLRCRADQDVFLSTDLAVRRTLDRLGAPSTPPAVADLAGRWSPYRSIALMQLWAAYLDL
jgi:AraC family transcriptional regulator of adaptative response / DNA-3-methyladenine glycosylase II